MVFQIVTPTLYISIMIALGIVYGLPMASPLVPQQLKIGNLATKSHFAIAAIAANFASVQQFH